MVLRSGGESVLRAPYQITAAVRNGAQLPDLHLLHA